MHLGVAAERIMRGQMRLHRRLLWTAPALLFALAGCGQTPDETEKARGVLAGVPFVLAMSVIFVVLMAGAIGAAVVLDRAVRMRGRLAEAPPPAEPEEEPDEIVAGITIRRAPVPRWLYGAYVLIPVFAMAYVLSNVAVAPAPDAAEETPAAEQGPCTDCTVIAQQIKFTISELEVVAGEEITVTFDNEDSPGVPHDFTVWEDKAAADAAGDSVATTGQIAAGNQGETSFNADEVTFYNCTIHPASMFGDIVAAEG